MKLTDGADLIESRSYAENGPPHESWKQLREHSPVHRCEPEGWGPFWAITKHEDICRIGKDPESFLSYPGITKQPLGQTIDREEGIGAMRTIIEMDPPQHREFRKVASPFFTPRAMRHVESIVQESARDLLDELAGRDGECDFAMDVAVKHPLRVLCTILGVSREQEPRILELTNQLFAGDDEELGFKGEDRDAEIMKLGLELFQLFEPIIADRRANPRDDLATVLANGKVNGEPMGPMETLGYYLITFTAGHDTTKNALAGGMHALVNNPEQFQKLRNDPGLAKTAVEEIVRWTSPVNYMKRTASRDAVVGEQKIAEGEEVILFYASGNRDADVFDEPFAFRVDRTPNRHIGFGHGEHFCLGAHLARRSQVALITELARRVESVEQAGPEQWIESSFVVGLKHLPVRYKMAD
ncbi:MAG: cytochrome P450 [Myxococcota bacterium]